MKPIFTVHAGEYLVGSFVEQKLRDNKGNKFKVWLPSKDTGVDLLVTNQANSKTASIQVKFSKDFLVTHGSPEYQKKLISCGWFTLNRNKLVNSTVDFWIFVLNSFNQNNMRYVIIQPKELLERLNILHPNVKSLSTYLWVTKSKKCWEARGLKKKETDLIVDDKYRYNNTRDFSKFLNNWAPVIKKLT